MTVQVSRETLYAEIWAEPMTTVAARYGVSSSFLARVCTDLAVPRPPRGYWAKLAVGQRATKPALPSAGPGDRLEWARGQGPSRQRRELPVAPAQRSRRRRGGRVQPDAPHPLVVDAR